MDTVNFIIGAGLSRTGQSACYLGRGVLSKTLTALVKLLTGSRGLIGDSSWTFQVPLL